MDEKRDTIEGWNARKQGESSAEQNIDLGLEVEVSDLGEERRKEKRRKHTYKQKQKQCKKNTIYLLVSSINTSNLIFSPH